MLPNHAVLAVHRNAGEIADMLIGAGQAVEHRRFAAVLVSGKRKGERRSLRQWVLPRLDVVFAALAKTGVRRSADRLRLCFLRCLIHERNLNVLRVCQPKRQLIPMDFQFHGISHRSQLDHRNLGSRDQAHIEKMLAQRALSANGEDFRCLPRFQFL